MSSKYLREPQNYAFTTSNENYADELASAYLLENLDLKRDSSTISNTLPVPLTTSKLANQAQQPLNRGAFKKLNIDPTTSSYGKEPFQNPRDTIFAKLNEKQLTSEMPKRLLSGSNSNCGKEKIWKDLRSLKRIDFNHDDDSYSGDSTSLTPSSDTHSQSFGSKVEPGNGNVDELQRLKEELAVAKCQIARMDLEISQNKITKHTIDQALSSPSDQEFFAQSCNSNTLRKDSSVSFDNDGQPLLARNTNWNTDDSRSELGDSTCAASHQGSHASWNNPLTGVWQPNNASNTLHSHLALPTSSWTGSEEGALNANSTAQSFIQPNFSMQQHSHRFASSRADFLNRASGTFNNPALPGHTVIDHGGRRFPSPFSRPNSAFGAMRKNQGWGQFTNNGLIESISPSPPLTPASFQSSNVFPAIGRPMALSARLSPTAAEFENNNMPPTPWNTKIINEPPAFVHHTEPINYRKLLDRNMSCNWKYIVDKIVGNNDQQASIFLQQKLKAGTSDHKYEIVEAIIGQAYALMVNRFGNFLVQRCFEHGTTGQIIAIANAIRGNTLNLSMDAFGCHVVQKAFDSVPEEYKAIMVHELLRRIPETVIHRYACHVWQKLFELRWSDSPPQIMKYVNESLCGMWHEVALGETGSLVVQNIFENCLEEDKRPCINEVLASIDVIAHGQFGNWCIQHICEHGSSSDRSRAIDHILRLSIEYSMDQYASKVIEKCLKVCGTNFLDRYLGRVCEGRPDRPRMPLIDIAGDQFGNYLIQYILIHASPQHREVVATHVRKHMVSLRGSKYGSRVAMLCCNPAFATRPGPPAGMQPGRYGNGAVSGRSALSAYR